MSKKGRQQLLGHRLSPETFWLDGDMVDGLQCGLCHRSFPTLDEVEEFGQCDVWVDGDCWCMTAEDLWVPDYIAAPTMIAHRHPECPQHGDSHQISSADPASTDPPIGADT